MPAATDPAQVEVKKTGSTSREIEERLNRLEARQEEIVNVLAGVSQAGRWVKQQIEAGEL